MKKASTTNKNIIFIGILAIAIVAVTIAVISERSNPGIEIAENNFVPLEGAVTNSYQVPNEISDAKDYDTLIGDKKAELKVVVYEDYSNIFSVDLAETLDLLKQEYEKDLAIISRPFITINSTESKSAALNYLCAQELGKGAEMRNLLLQQSGQEILSFDYPDYAEELGIDEYKFVSCLTNEDKMVKLEEIKKEAKDSLVLGSPVMLIGDEMIVGARPYADFVDSNGDTIEGLKTVIKRHLEDKS